jgi:hypothetical protein
MLLCEICGKEKSALTLFPERFVMAISAQQR